MSTVSLNPIAAISLLHNHRTTQELRQIHAHVIKSNLVFDKPVLVRLVTSYALSGDLSDLGDTLLLLRRIRQPPEPFAFFSFIRDIAESENPLDSIALYSQVIAFSDNLRGLELLLPSILKACGKSSALKEGRQVHGQILKNPCFQDDPFVVNSVLRMYLELGEVAVARKVFDGMPNRDVISWNSMISGCLKAGEIELALFLFDEMPQKDVISCNIMIDGLMKSGMCEVAIDLFENMIDRDVVSWTGMISGYVLNGWPKEALQTFRRMLQCGVRPDVAALVNVLSAVADLGFPDEGKWIHAYIDRSNVNLLSGNLGSALIDMYSKCGLVSNAYSVFKRVSNARRLGDWNSMLSGLALHGLGREALQVFDDMERIKLKPDEVTFLGILNACSHSGLVEEGQSNFNVMLDRYKLKPSLQHYGCLVDLFSRAGELEAAQKVIEEMPMRPDATAWKSVLSACVQHGNVILGENAAKKATELAPGDSSCYVLLSNLYARSAQWSEVNRVRELMKERNIRKAPGCSSLMIKGHVHEFIVGKKMGEEVSSKLEEVVRRLKLEGYEPDVSQVLVNVDESDKESLLRVHSEKMAVAFGLVNLERGAIIHIVKNLRVCGDCHSFCKVVSRVYRHEIVLRDQNRFHHFKDGSCSCHEYW